MPNSIFQLTEEEEQRTPFTTIQRKLFILEGLKGGSKRIGNTQSNHVILIRDCANTEVIIVQNQRVNSIFYQNLENCKIVLLDSCVVAARSLTILNCKNCEFVFEDVDVRRIAAYNTSDSKFTYTHSPPVVDNVRFFWREECYRNTVQLALLKHVEHSQNVEFDVIDVFRIPDSNDVHLYCSYFDDIEKIHSLLFESHNAITQDGQEIYDALAPYIPQNFHQLLKIDEILFQLDELESTEFALPSKVLSEAYDKEREEFEDSDDVIREKVRELIKYLTPEAHTVFFTGAGISTAANLPDFRGPQGVWTLRSKGQMAKAKNLTQAFPTFSHFAITELAKRKLIKFIVTTNMDSLHLRTGLPKHFISEQHGNCHKERCEDCGSLFYRQFDTLSTVYSSRSHVTGRKCTWCGGRLLDTIIHFSESLYEDDIILSSYHARKSDLSIVMGTSMNVQPAACYPDKTLRHGGKLVIVNLQKTPYDNLASIRIFAKTDKFMEVLMDELNIKEFDQETDILPTWDKKEGEEEEEEDDRPNYVRKFLFSVFTIAAVGLAYYFSQ